jgi:hypothetical protein
LLLEEEKEEEEEEEHGEVADDGCGETHEAR